MERRKLLIGSAGALATVLAGCTGSGGGGDDGSEDDGTSDDEGDDVTDLGIDPSKVDLDGHDVAVDVGGDDDEELHIEVSAPEDESDAERVLEKLVDALADAIDNEEKFVRKVETVYVSVVDDEDPVLGFYVDVEWAIEYLEGNLSEAELRELAEAAES